MRTLLLAISITFALTTPSIAQNKSVVLKKQKIQGQVRRPEVQWVDAKTRAKELIPELYEKLFRDLESELLNEEKPKDE